VGFAPYRPYPFLRRLAPWPFLWLGCWSANNRLALDMKTVLSQICLNLCQRSHNGDQRELRPPMTREVYLYLAYLGAPPEELPAAIRSPARRRSYAVRRLSRRMIPCAEPGGQIS
jgi:hypothetical protein